MVSNIRQRDILGDKAFIRSKQGDSSPIWTKTDQVIHNKSLIDLRKLPVETKQVKGTSTLRYLGRTS